MGRLILTVQDLDAQFPFDAALIASAQHPWVVTKSVLEQEFLGIQNGPANVLE